MHMQIGASPQHLIYSTSALLSHKELIFADVVLSAQQCSTLLECVIGGNAAIAKTAG